MNKQLKVLRNAFEKGYEIKLVDDTWYYVKENKIKGIVMVESIKQALTPPTADEICKALSDYSKQFVENHKPTVVYKWNLFILYKDGEMSRILVKTIDGEIIETNVYLPPHLITMIGRFYSSLGDR